MVTHHHAFGETGGDQPISQKIVLECLQDFKMEFLQDFTDLKFPIVRDNLVHFEHRIRLKDEGAPPPHCKIYPLDQGDFVELKKQITDMLSKNQIRLSDSPYGSPILFAKKKDGRFRLSLDYRA